MTQTTRKLPKNDGMEITHGPNHLGVIEALALEGFTVRFNTWNNSKEFMHEDGSGYWELWTSECISGFFSNCARKYHYMDGDKSRRFVVPNCLDELDKAARACTVEAPRS